MKIVFTAGGFDPLHLGHLKLIQESKKLGDYLIVSVASTENMINKKGYEFMPFEDRLEIIRELKSVDEVEKHIGTDGTVIKNLERLRRRFPDCEIIFTKGGDWTKDTIPEKEICDKLGIKIVDGLVGTINSSSKLVERIRNKNKEEEKEMSEMNDMFQVDYLPEKREIRINLPEKVWKNIDTVTLTRLFQEELVVEKQKRKRG